MIALMMNLKEMMIRIMILIRPHFYRFPPENGINLMQQKKNKVLEKIVNKKVMIRIRKVINKENLKNLKYSNLN